MPRPPAIRPTAPALAGILALLLLALRPAHAQTAAPEPPPAAAATTAAGSGENTGHGWAIINTGPKSKPTLVHLAPRQGPGAAVRGSMAFAAWLGEAPQRITTWHHRVYLALAPLSPGGPRPVATLHAERLVGGIWEMRPPGRLRILPALPAQDALVGFAGSGVGLVALLRGHAEDGRGPWRLLTLRGPEWSEVTIPPEALAELGDDPALVGTPDGAVLLTKRSTGAAAWTIYIPLDGVGLWRRTEVRWGDAPAGGEVFGLDGRLMRVRPEGAALALDLIRPGAGGGVYPVATLPDVPLGAQVVPLDGAGTLALIWPGETADAAAPAAARPQPYRVREISALSGRTLFDGSAAGATLVASQQFRLLAVALMLVTVTVLLFILRPEGRPAAVLPPGVDVAEPGRRVAAAMADFLLGLLAASWITGIEASQILGPSLLSGSIGGSAALALALAATWAHSTVGEWLAGRSIGKVLAGCEVIRIAPAADGPGPLVDGERVEAEGSTAGDGGASATHAAVADGAMLRPALWQAMIRNLVRWGLPPIGVWLLIDAGGRHPGDLLARTVVVVRRSPDHEEAGGRP